MQTFNIELGKRIKSGKLDDAENIVFWTWVNANTIGIVTDTAAYHWSSDGEAAPVKMFDRHESLAGAQIISYGASADGKWLFTAGMRPGGAPGAPPTSCMQLYSVERRAPQALVASAGCFTTTRLPDRADPAMLFVFVEHKPDAPKPKLQVIEVGRDPAAVGAPFRIAPVELPTPADAAGDFVVSVRVNKKNDIVYVFTKLGYVYLFDLHSGGVIFRHRISEAPVFATAVHEDSGGVLAVSVKAGQVFHVTLNEATAVPYIMSTLHNQRLALGLASRLGLPGAEEVYAGEFDRLLTAGDVDGAARLAASSPALRTRETILRFQALPGGAAMKYFTAVMARGALNKVESIELARPALAQGRGALLDKWLKEDKLDCSVELGEMVAPYDPRIALAIYMKAGTAHEHVINCLVLTGEFDKIVPYATEKGYTPNYMMLLQNLVHVNPKVAQDFARDLVKHAGGPLVAIDAAVDIFMHYGRLQECTTFLLSVLDEDKREEGYLQTRLLEMNLLGGAPQVVDAILGSGMFHHFDKKHVAQLCERAQLFTRALELFEDLPDIKRCVMLLAHDVRQHDFLVKFFGSMTPDKGLACLNELMTNRANEALVAKIATQYSEQMTPAALIRIFETAKSFTGLYYYLGAIVNTSDNPEVHYKYIVAATELKQFKEVERVCRDSTVYDAELVKRYLIDAKLADPRPLIHVCDRHGYIDELTTYLFTSKLPRFIEVYVQKVSPKACARVVGRLLDLEAEEAFIQALIVPVPTGPIPPPMEGAPAPNICRVEELVDEVEKRNRLRLLQPWLEQKIGEGNTEAATHNALGKIYVMTNNSPQEFLRNNRFYDSRVLGRFCEKLDPYLAFLAYRRAAGACDDLLLEVTDKSSLFKDQARYLVERRDPALWARVLVLENPHRQEVVDEVIGTALPETKNAEDVSVTVKAFIDADLPQQLIGLLEKLVLSGGEFATNKNLQNLLILTAIRCTHAEGADPNRAMDYILRLDNYDGLDIAEIALKDEFQLYEEAFAIYKKFDQPERAAHVLIDRIGNLERAHEFADRINNKAVWTMLAVAQLRADAVKDAVDSYIKAEDSSNYREVITTANRAGAWDDLVRFLDFARVGVRERVIDTELTYAYARAGRLADLEVFLTTSNVADLQEVGDRCVAEGAWQAARILFAASGNNSQLATCLLALELYREAVDAAKKANSIRTWKEVNAACVRAGEFKLAEIAGLPIIEHADHLEELIHHYESLGHWEQLVALIEKRAHEPNPHKGILTELGVLYCKYVPDRLMDHVRRYAKEVNVSKLLRACAQGRHWPAATFIFVANEDFDSAIRCMIDHSPTAFALDTFLDAIPRVRNSELFYQAVQFFYDEEPLNLVRLLRALAAKIDHARVVHLLRKTAEGIRLALPYLMDVQSNNIVTVNEAINDTLIEEEDYAGLRRSIEEHTNFDQLELAARLEKHELLEFRRIAAFLFKRNRKFDRSIDLSKADGMFKDAIDTAAASADRKVAEELLRWFVDEKHDAAAFAATLFTCYSLIRPDLALELAWRNHIIDFVMPFVIQYVRDVDHRIHDLEKRIQPSDAHTAEQEALAAAGLVPTGALPGGVLALTNFAANPTAAVGGGFGPGGYPGAGFPGAVPGGFPGAGFPGAVPGGFPGAGFPGAPGGFPGAAGLSPDIYTMSGAGTPGRL